ncbi:hypothetical protein EMCG_09378 [[Emmonsia] crescens]|uniref:Uncharacterized protein n=1 Tax=[Emmonsia] crescens TaxID=73230 RepID=A0A0G2J9W8_9EURO|nr:hypothetical protein EMCG_09378 [Emmonsia crescens UAMH 3008]
MKFLVVFLTLMTASVWAAAIPAPEAEPVSSGNGGVLAPVKVVSGLQPTATMDCAAVDFQVSGSCTFFALYLVIQA